ncbi:recombinase RecA [Halosimplex litoreum]|uniref:Recombinase RecA n=1 Tax=Halosimplex litoreum TaxID=1198301 RepID=A0A7T3FZK8_9EURY|nr:ATPase domain-containing protein [Halosimplex litoreum]QPV63557.1 recombinase RecA [Halosimplex litoreum]
MYDLGSMFGNATVAPGTNLLVSGPPLSGKRRMALDVLAHGSERGEGVIVVTTRDSASRVLNDYEALVSDPGSVDIGIVDCVTKHQGRSARDTDIVKYASSPEDMTGIGIKFSEFVEEFRQERGVENVRVLVDSLSTLLMYSDVQTVFRFMHVFTSRIENADAMGIHVIESTAHDDETLNTLQQLFDHAVAVEVDGSVSTTIPDAEPGPLER